MKVKVFTAKQAKLAKEVTPIVLQPEHLRDLKKSGLELETIQKAGIKSIDSSEVCALLGFNPKGVESAYLIPYRSFRDFVRVRVFPEVKDKSGRKRKYLQPKKSSPHFYFPHSLDEVILGDASQPIFIVEGEKKCLSAAQKGLKNSIGIAGIWSWRKDHMPFVDFDFIKWHGRQVHFIPDSDVWRREDLLFGCYAFCKELEKRGANVRIIALSNQKDGDKCGLDDYFLSHSLSAFYSLPRIGLLDTNFHTASEAYVKWEKKHLSQISLLSQRNPKKQWPLPPAQEAYYGLAGDFVRLVEPATESDSVAILVQFLTAFGNLIGRSAHFTVEADTHFSNLFTVLVGDTSKGRKGTSWGRVKAVFKFDEHWLLECVKSGLSSGEGLIYAVRDSSKGRSPIKEKGRIVDYQEIITDEGVVDKRLLVLEPEFASTLRMLEREGNVLSSQMRQAWDTGNLRVLTRVSPISATNAHISIIGHITATELKRYLQRTEIANGFGNRFLWICSRRSKSLPEGGTVDIFKLNQIIGKVRAVVQSAKKVGELKRDESARRIWIDAYDKLSEGKPGLYGAMLGRAEAQVMRLAMLYALLDKSSKICGVHLKAALALWHYAEQSVIYIFGERLGDPVAEMILAALRQHYPNPLSLSQISDLFNRHQEKAAIHAALEYLQSMNSAVCEVIQTSGRSAQVWKAVIEGENHDAR